MSAVPKGEIEAQVRGNQMWWSQETQRSLSHPAEGFLGPWPISALLEFGSSSLNEQTARTEGDGGS